MQRYHFEISLQLIRYSDMKILFDHPNPFLLAHGGFQIQIEETKQALEEIGIEVEWLRWWDDSQKGDLIHYFGVPHLSYIRQAQSKTIPVILTHLLTSQCNRSNIRLAIQGLIARLIQTLPGGRTLGNRFGWESLQEADRIIVGLECEKNALKTLFGINECKIELLPLGLHRAFFEAATLRTPKKDYLICAGTITTRKNSVALAHLALAAKVPILFVGKPYSDSDPYWQEFQALIDNRWVLHQPHVSAPTAMVSLLRSASGAVVMSDYENWCLSAHEAAACGLPLLLQDQNWSRERFGDQASYFEKIGFSVGNAEILKKFYAAASTLPAPLINLYSWADTARLLKVVYERVLSLSR